MDNLQVDEHIARLKDATPAVRAAAAEELGKIGDANTLPRRILAYSRFSPQERIEVLDTLRDVLGFGFADTRTLCRTVLNEEDAETRQGAQMVIDWLEADNHPHHSE